jgi:hypothetical protein
MGIVLPSLGSTVKAVLLWFIARHALFRLSLRALVVYEFVVLSRPVCVVHGFFVFAASVLLSALSHYKRNITARFIAFIAAFGRRIVNEVFEVFSSLSALHVFGVEA